MDMDTFRMELLSKLKVPALRIEHLWAMAILSVIFFLLTTHPIRPHDFWWHLRVGEIISTSGTIPQTDTFSHTVAGQPYENYAAFWIIDAGTYLLYEAGGAPLVIFIHSVIIAAAYAILLLLCWRISSSWRIAAGATFFAGVLGFNNWNVRPQSVSFLFGTLVLWNILTYQRSKNWRWLIPIPVIMALWANCHGSFIIGLALLGIWLLAQTWHALVHPAVSLTTQRLKLLIPPTAILAVSVMAVLINPRGFGLYRYALDLSGSAIIQDLVTEWAAPTFDSIGGVIILGSILLGAALLAISPKRPDAFQLLCFLVFAALSLKMKRAAVWYGIAFAPILADHVEVLATTYLPHRNGRASTHSNALFVWFNYLLASLLLIGNLLGLPWLKKNLPLPEIRQPLISAETPVAATAYLLKEDPPGPIFNEVGFGSYLIWAAYPDYPVFADTRLELYSYEFWVEYILISNGFAGWDEKLDQYGINTLMLSQTDQPRLVEAVRGDPHWELIYEDQSALLFTRASMD